MKVVIRALEVTTIIITILLMTVVGIAAYSVKDLQVGYGYSSITQGTNQSLILSLPFYINNVGLTNLRNFKLTTTVLSLNNSAISQDSTFVENIQKGNNATIQHNVTLSIDRLIQNSERYLLQDENLTVRIDTEMTLAEILPCNISTNFSLPWGAPLHNLTLSQPKTQPFNSTHMQIEASLSFENHAAFPLRGKVSAEVFNSAETNESNVIFLDVSPGSAFQGDFRFFVPLSDSADSFFSAGNCSLYFSTDLFEYGPLVIRLG